MRGDHLNAFRHLKSGKSGIHNKRTDPARARRFTRARKHDIEIGDAAIGDPGLLTIQHIRSAIFCGGTLKRGHVRTGLGFGERERSHGGTARHAREILRALCRGACQRDGTGSEPLHGKRKIREPAVTGQGLTQQAHRSRIDRLGGATKRVARHGVAQPAALAKRAHEGETGGIHVRTVCLLQVRGAPGVERRREFAMSLIKERPLQMLQLLMLRRRHGQSPWNSGRALATKA